MFSGATFKGMFKVNNFCTNAAALSKYFCGRRLQPSVALEAVQTQGTALLMHPSRFAVGKTQLLFCCS